ncbi:Pheromone P-factor receptor [Neolecta irregularis DAH-3]|uniref:Pheromone P-factor receptor n=1 Tax=Neolecta irregularis (strain DAH-3) TaxID=1198029 RepID=A0A1U7LLP0_NEOID|nr:Pheromone P-factor receptor [Neolecta irregularis DAH-3]|eukprot:OLL23575.1 Pheromone P-factor receptor [Neolecta irregularis DAH-3]
MSAHNRLGYSPLSQPLVMFGPHGENVTLTLNELEEAMFPRLVNCSTYTSHIAMCAGVLFVLLITTQRDRLKTPVHIFNILSLISSIIFSAMQYISMTGPAFQIEVQLFHDFTTLSRKDTNLARIIPILGSIVVGFIEFSLVLQCRSVFASYKSIRKWMTLVITSVATAVTSWCLAVDIHRSLTLGSGTGNFTWMDKSKNVVFAFSICFFSSIFVSKLWKSIHTRRNLGFRQFGPLQVIFIMACQSMILPLIFCFIGVFYPSKYAVSHTARIMVVINLPLSSVWAAAQADMTTDDNISSLMPSFFQTVDSEFSNGLSLGSGNALVHPYGPGRPKFDESKNMDLTIGTYLANKGYKDTNAL